MTDADMKNCIHCGTVFECLGEDCHLRTCHTSGEPRICTCKECVKKVHLCKKCTMKFPVCNGTPKFGFGPTNDNVYFCGSFKTA